MPGNDKNSKFINASDPIIWDAHSCLPLSAGEPFSSILRHKSSGYDYVSVNIGMDKQNIEQVLDTTKRFTDFIHSEDSGCCLVSNTRELQQAKEDNLLAISFDLEGIECVAHDLSLLVTLYELGLRQIALAYNLQNSFCGGCLTPDIGLTAKGREAIKLANTLGLLLDCSHISHQASLEVMSLSEKPVTFSHANPAALKPHPRNLSDQQIVTCAAQGGVIGVNGIGLFLGNNSNSTELWYAHFEYLVNLAGWEHVGIGLDYCYSDIEMNKFPAENPEICYPHKKINMVQPEQLNELIDIFWAQGYSKKIIKGILGGNFHRVATQVWNNELSH